ncbi:MAG: BCD family MFS transporter [Pseudomonadota bacterium]
MTEPRMQKQSPMIEFWQSVGTKWLPFADAASADLSMAKLLRLTLFQWTVGMAAVLLTGTLNRVMIVELGVPTWLVACVIAIPVLAAPFRIVMGYRSDSYRSLLGWRRVPYIWLGSMLQFGGLAIMPFALLMLQSQTVGPEWAGPVAAALAFLLTGTGMHMVQTAGLALATDLSTPETRSRVVALSYIMLLLGMLISAIVFAVLLADFTALRLIQVVQGAAVVTLAINLVASWKQEPRNCELTAKDRTVLSFDQALGLYRSDPVVARLLTVVFLGAMAFAMQEVLLEPYGGEVLGLGVSQTTALTAIWACGSLLGFIIAGRRVERGGDIYRLCAIGLLAGVVAFSMIIFAEPLASENLFRAGVFVVGVGAGIFGVGTLLAAMERAQTSDSGMAIGAWGAVNATAIGCGLAAGGIVRDAVNFLIESGWTAGVLSSPSAGYSVVYHLEIGLLFMTIAVLGPLVGHAREHTRTSGKIGLAEMPG